MRIVFNKALFKVDIVQHKEELVAQHGFNRNQLDQYCHDLASPKMQTLVALMNAMSITNASRYFVEAE